MITLPENLKKGDKIAVISPAGSVEPTQLEKGLKMLEERGYKPVLGKHVYTVNNEGYNYAGTEKQRQADLQWALDHNEIKAIWVSRGGYGCQHLLEGLSLKAYKKNPKWFIGYSDNTVIQSYLMQKGFASLHAQSIKTSGFGVSEESYALVFDVLSGKALDYKFPTHDLNTKGKAKGRLVGGNLALVYALLGTKYSFDFKDNILFIEEIGENFYALDRMMMSLEHAGVFNKIKGIIVGGMTNMGKEGLNPHYEESFDDFAYSIIAKRLAKYDFPKLFGFPNGHIYENLPLIIGSKIEIKSGKKSSIKFLNK